ncbi:peptidoglycan recognition protein family protein [Caloranaerobacter ferrireducens]|uniref:peptidoglycan recognition protein family protein n=1 Tax=Caloranaerobacter ferrireducens TaxID=1323370 RepID=UPI00241EC09D|nr:peptidoglycan recognition family protein [Caloranaerobacter ferrireducens]
MTKKLIKCNYSLGNDIKYIVIHDTGNKRKGADAYAHYRYFNSGNRRASAHYFVDDKEILQLVEDHNASWHCGDGKGKYRITNHNSIGVEICINEDGNYDKAVQNTIDLVKYLMEKYDIPLERVVRHYDASRKICPRSMSKNNWERWHNFKKELSKNSKNKFKEALGILNKKGIINSPKYWLKNAVKGKMVNGEYAAVLIERVAKFINKKEGR